MDFNVGKYTNLSESAQIKATKGLVYGFIVNSHTSGKLKLWDNTAGSGTVLMNEFTFPSGSGVYTFPAPIDFNTGLYATISGTADITIIWK